MFIMEVAMNEHLHHDLMKEMNRDIFIVFYDVQNENEIFMVSMI